MHEFCFFLDWQGITPSEWAAWVQAVGSVGAILVAVWVPHRLDARRVRLEKERDEVKRKESLVRARSMAVVLMPEVRSLISKVSSAIYESRAEFAEEHLDDLASSLDVPPKLKAHVGLLHDLGEPGVKLQAALMYLEDSVIKINTEEFRQRYGAQDPDLYDEPATNFEDALARTKRALEDVATGLMELFPEMHDQNAIS